MNMRFMLDCQGMYVSSKDFLGFKTKLKLLKIVTSARFSHLSAELSLMVFMAHFPNSYLMIEPIQHPYYSHLKSSYWRLDIWFPFVLLVLRALVLKFDPDFC